MFEVTVSHDTDSVSDAGTVVITDVLPPELLGAVISATGADDTDFSNNTVTVTYNSIPVGESRTFNVTVDIDESATGTITNDASVTSVGTELDTSNDSAAAPPVTMNPDFDVTLTKDADVDTPGPNDTVTYTVEITNSGPSTAPGVILSDVIPTGLTFVEGTLDTLDASSDGTTVTFPAIDIASGDTETATLVFTVDASSVGQITNTASVQDLTAAGENDATNNSASEDIDVIPEADLSISKLVDESDAQAGTELTYTVTVLNSGPSTATNVVVADTLPAGVTFVEGTGPSGEDLTESGGVVNVSGGDLADGEDFAFTIVVTVDEGASGTQTNTATVSSDVADPDNTNDTATAVTDVDPRTSSISGRVYLDWDNDGEVDAGESGLTGIVITLTGTDTLGNDVNLTTTTDANGNYSFDDLAAGTYSVAETQPDGVRDGIETVGQGATAVASDNLFSQLVLGVGVDATDFNFAELNDPAVQASVLGIAADDLQFHYDFLVTLTSNRHADPDSLPLGAGDLERGRIGHAADG